MTVCERHRKAKKKCCVGQRISTYFVPEFGEEKIFQLLKRTADKFGFLDTISNLEEDGD